MKRDQPSSTSQPAIDCGADGVDHATVIWRQVFERSDFAIALGDRDGRTLLAVNPAFARMHQRGVDELAGAAIIEVFAPQAREAVTEHIRIANGSSHYAWESEHIRADESQFPVQIDGTPIRDDQGNLLFRVVYVQDISGRRRAEQALRDSESRLRLTVEAAGVGIFTQRFDGRPSEADDTTLAFFG